MTELAEGELCLPQRPHNQVGAVSRRSVVLVVLGDVDLYHSSVSRSLVSAPESAIRLIGRDKSKSGILEDFLFHWWMVCVGSK